MPVQKEKEELRRRLNGALLLPVAIIVMMGAALWVQIRNQVEADTWLAHTDAVLSEVSYIQREIVDQETGLRGFVITGDDLFLEPYRKAHPDDDLSTLRTLVADNPAQVERVDELRRRYDYWVNDRAKQVLEARPEAAKPEAMRESKRRMDAIRASVDAFERAELDLRAARNRSNESQLALMRGVFVVLAIVAGLGLVIGTRRQLAALATVYDDILVREREVREDMNRERWIREGHRLLAENLLGDKPLQQLAASALSTVAQYVGAQVGTMYVGEGHGWTRTALLGLPEDAAPAKLGNDEGFVGRAAEKKAPVHVTKVPADVLRVRSGVAEGSPTSIVAVPAIADGAVNGVVELGFFGDVPEQTLELLNRVAEALGVALRSESHRRRVRELLEESQGQAEELQTQQEELRAANEELEQQSAALRDTHQSLEERQQEIEAMNARLEERAHDLAQSREAFRAKAQEADRASRYKSEFLANMSHELRTPLNSTLILAKLLGDNQDKNLTEEQVRFARTIYSSGNDLLALINDVLDLSKVEAGHVDIHPTDVTLQSLIGRLQGTFEPTARQRRLTLAVNVEKGVPDTVVTDERRLEQILRNLLSNALKFTENGSVTLTVKPGPHAVLFEVTDTGIGIANEQLGIIFQPFRQADGTTNRKYGGTGLGLSISRELATLLGGTLDVQSTQGSGSTFRLTLPLGAQPLARAPSVVARELPPHTPKAHQISQATETRHTSTPAVSMGRAAFPDDREVKPNGQRSLLVVEDDIAFARILYDLAKSCQLRCLVAHDARSGIGMAEEHVPNAIVLDVNLPDHTGLYVLDQLKRSAVTRHIPVHVVSCTEYGDQAMAMGAVGFLEKPASLESLSSVLGSLVHRVNKLTKRLLIVEDDDVHRQSLTALLSASDVDIVAVGTAQAAVAALREEAFDCVVLDLGLPDASGYEFLEQLAADETRDLPPVIVYTGRSLKAEDEQRLRRYSSSIIVKGARSLERLVDEVTLFLHQVEQELPAPKRDMLRAARDREAILEDKEILVVEDDVRNIFALSKVLEPKGAKVVIARNGRDALEMLEKHPNVSLVLMDIMMPEMDGLEATRRIRQRKEWSKLPIIALTAKAMPDDRESCLAAGASDYIPKPIDVEMLLSLIRVWTPR